MRRVLEALPEDPRPMDRESGTLTVGFALAMGGLFAWMLWPSISRLLGVAA